MKQTRIIFFAAALYFLLFSLSDSVAQPTEPDPLELQQQCISCCEDKKTACFNVNPDRRLCEALFQNCLVTCKTEGETSSEWSECWPEYE